MEDTLALKSLLVFFWLLVFFVCERLRPAAPSDLLGRDARSLRRLGRNLGLWALNLGLSPLVVLPLTAAASAAAPGWRPEGWQGWPALLLDLLVLDFLIYWWHRANHEIQLLWRFHAVHHLDRTLDVTSALRFHFGEVLLSAGFRAVVVFALAIPFSHVVVFEAMVLLAAIFHHSNLRLPARVEAGLSRLVITPGIHWVHHHAIRRGTACSAAAAPRYARRICSSASNGKMRKTSQACSCARSADRLRPGAHPKPGGARQKTVSAAHRFIFSAPPSLPS